MSDLCNSINWKLNLDLKKCLLPKRLTTEYLLKTKVNLNKRSLIKNWKKFAKNAAIGSKFVCVDNRSPFRETWLSTDLQFQPQSHSTISLEVRGGQLCCKFTKKTRILFVNIFWQGCKFGTMLCNFVERSSGKTVLKDHCYNIFFLNSLKRLLFSCGLDLI